MPSLIRRLSTISVLALLGAALASSTRAPLVAQADAGTSAPWSCWTGSSADAAAWRSAFGNGECGPLGQPEPVRLDGRGLSATALPISVPGVPTALAATVDGHTVVLKWRAPAGADPAISYVLEAGSAVGRRDLANTDTGSAAPMLAATGVPAGTYYVRLRARNRSGTSAPSSEIAVTVGAADCAGSPTAPGGLTAAVNGSGVTLSWQPSSGACVPTSYVVEAGSLSGLSNLAVASTGSTATTFSAAGVGSGLYFVRVRAANFSGTSGPSNEVQIAVGGCSGPPSVPGSFSARVGGTTVTLYWLPSSGSPSSYVLEAGSSPGASNLVVSDTGGPATTLWAAAGAGTFYVRLRARNACGTSAASAEVTIVIGGTATTTRTWTLEGALLTDVTSGFPGAAIADVTAFRLNDGRFRLHYTAGKAGRSAVTANGVALTVEGGVRFADGQCGLPRALRLDDGRVRMFCRSSSGIVSYTSTDEGLTFVADAGVRLTPQAAGVSILAGLGIVRTSNGWRMYITESEAAGLPTRAFRMFSATSPDTLTWTVDPGVRLGPGSAVTGSINHPSAIVETNGSVTVFYWRPSVPGAPYAVWSATSPDGLTFTSETNTGVAFAEDPDVVALPGGGYRMYYDDGDNVSGTLYSARSSS